MAKSKAHKKAHKTPKPAQKKLRQRSDAFEHALIAWYAPNFLRYERGWMWYLFFGLLDVALIAYAVFSDSWTMALAFIVTPLVYLWEHREKPKMVDVNISSFGIKYGHIRIPFSNIHRFWIIHEPHTDELHLRVKSKMHPEVVIPLMRVNPILLRQYLITQIPEWEGKQLSLIDTIARLLRF